MIQYYYQMALTGVGEAYLEAERLLIAQGQEAATFVQRQLNEAARVEKLTAQVLLQRIAGNEVFTAVLSFFDQVEQQTALTAKGAPSPEWVAGKLFLDFGGQVAPLLGVYLNKLAPIWPNWKIMGVILYLGKLTSTASADALTTFMIATPSEHYRKFALQSLVAVGDADVLVGLEAELKSRAVVQAALQQAAAQIAAKLKG